MRVIENQSRVLLRAIHHSVKEITDNEGDIEKVLTNTDNQLDIISTIFNLSRQEALTFALIVAASLNEPWVTARDLAHTAQCKESDLIALLADIESLQKKNIITGSYKNRYGSFGALSEFCLNLSKTTRQIMFSGFLASPSDKTTSIYSLMKETEELIKERKSQELTTQMVIELVEDMLNSPKGIPLNSKMNVYELNAHDKCLLIYLFQKRIMDTDKISLEKFCFYYFDTYEEQILYWRNFRSAASPLIKSGLVELDNNLDMKLTNLAINEFLPDEIYLISDNINKDLISPDKINYEELYFPETVQNKLDTIINWSMPKNFERYGGLLKKKGFYNGITILLNGPPGTGKTQWCYNLSKITGYPIYKVDVEDLNRPFFGETESRTKDVFNRVREFSKSLGSPIILLFNEGDAIINMRNHNDKSGVGRAHNAVQSIIMQELEQFQSIFIMTTNFGQCIDEAYSRRFTYQILLPRPDERARYKIWEKHYPTFSMNSLKKLSEFELSGGEISNLIKKIIVFELENNVVLGTEDIVSMIENDRSQILKNPIGFK